MRKEEIKEGMEKISGGTDAKPGKKPGIKEPYLALMYGVVKPYGVIGEILEERREETRKAQDSKDALATSQPQDGEKK